MKQKLLNAISIILCVLMVAAALLIGIRSGWMDERQEALNQQGAWVVDSSTDLERLNSYAADCANLAVVAARHLGTDDLRVVTLRSAYAAYAEDASSAQLAALAQANAQAAEAAAALAEELPALASVQASERDQVYVSTLCRVVATPPSCIHSASQEAAAQFNARLNASLLGRLAMLLGVQPLDE